jgi:hypothetical protein
LKNNVNVVSKSNRHKKHREKKFVAILKATDENIAGSGSGSATLPFGHMFKKTFYAKSNTVLRNEQKFQDGDQMHTIC